MDISVSEHTKEKKGKKRQRRSRWKRHRQRRGWKEINIEERKRQGRFDNGPGERKRKKG